MRVLGMPISGPASYLPTLDLFIPHWNDANAALAPAPPITLGGTAVAGLVALRTTLTGQRAGVESARNGLEGARATIELSKAALLERLNQFNSKLPSVDAGPVLLAMLPKAFSQGDAMGKVLPPLDDMEDVWTRHDAGASAPLTLRDSYDLAMFGADLASLKAAYTAYGQAKNDLTQARGRRNETQDKIRPLLVNYRKRIAADFAEGSAILEGLPAYSPPDNGPAPEPVALSGTYDAADAQAELAWSPVTDENVTGLELRATVGPEYEAEDEEIIATFAPDAPPSWAGTYGLLVPGSATSFKLYTLTATGRERGSNPVTVTRPA